MSPITWQARQPDIPLIVAMAVVQPVDAEGLPVAFRVALEQELVAARRALFVGLLDHNQDVADCELVVSPCVFWTPFLPVLDHIPLQPSLDQSAAWGRLLGSWSEGALDVPRR